MKEVIPRYPKGPPDAAPRRSLVFVRDQRHIAVPDKMAGSASSSLIVPCLINRVNAMKQPVDVVSENLMRDRR
jgi:hypothetical protein